MIKSNSLVDQRDYLIDFNLGMATILNNVQVFFLWEDYNSICEG